MEYAQLQSFVFVLMSICGGVVSIAAAVAIVVKFWKWAHAGSDKNAEDIESLKDSYESAKNEYMSWFASDKRRIENLEGDFDIISDQNMLLMRAVVAIMGHQLDGNNTEKLTSVRDEVENYLFTNKKPKRRETE